MASLEDAALKNQSYYLLEQKEDDCKNHWYRYVKTLEHYAEPILLTPEMAKELVGSVDSVMEVQRTPIVLISFLGNLFDGHEVLKTIVTSNKSMIVFCSFNVSDKLNFLFETI